MKALHRNWAAAVLLAANCMWAGAENAWAADSDASVGWFSRAANPNPVGSSARTPSGAALPRAVAPATHAAARLRAMAASVSQPIPPETASDNGAMSHSMDAADGDTSAGWMPGAITDHEMVGGECCELESGCRPCGMFYVGAEYLMTRPRFSQAVFMVQRTTTTDAQTLINQFTDKTVDYEFQYDSSFRALIGYHLCGCGGDIQFTYWRLTSDSQMSSGIVNLFSNPGTIIAGQLGVNPRDPIGPANPGANNPTADNEALRGSLHLAQNIYDLDFSKCLPLGGGDSSCDPCGCPAWELRWLAGARATNMARLEENAAAVPGQSPSKVGEIFTRFAGGGPRIGILGRRYVGKNGCFSIYAKGNQSLLLGTTSITRRRITNPSSPINPVIIDEQLGSFVRAVPCTEIEVGGGVQVSPHAFVSVGWFAQAWWDLGMPEQPDGSTFGSLSSANILAWDGLFVRGEFVY